MPIGSCRATFSVRAPRRRPEGEDSLDQRRRGILLRVLGLAGAVGLAVAAYLVYDGSNYVRTDNATVAGNVVSVYAPTTGRLQSWGIALGQPVRAGQVLGTMRVEVAAAGPQLAGVGGTQLTFLEIKAPVDGVVVQTTAVVGQQVFPGAGAPLAVTADPSDLWVVANVSEADVHRFRIGAPVDVKVDAVPGVTFSGSVDTITDATQATFSILPAANGGGQFTKVSQLIPVKIRLDPTALLNGGLRVGESAEVAIHVR